MNQFNAQDSTDSSLIEGAHCKAYLFAFLYVVQKDLIISAPPHIVIAFNNSFTWCDMYLQVIVLKKKNCLQRTEFRVTSAVSVRVSVIPIFSSLALEHCERCRKIFLTFEKNVTNKIQIPISDGLLASSAHNISDDSPSGQSSAHHNRTNVGNCYRATFTVYNAVR